MNAFVNMIWGTVPNKRQVLMTALVVCIVLSLLGGSSVWFAFKVKLYHNQTIVEGAMEHFHRYGRHDAATIAKHTELLASLPGNRDQSIRYHKLTDDMRDLRREQRQSQDENGNWISDFHKNSWRQDMDGIKKEIDKLEENMDDRNSFYQSGIQYANRDR